MRTPPGGDDREAWAAPDLAAMIRARAGAQPDALAFRYLADGEAKVAELSYGALDRQARLIAGHLRWRVPPGGRALLQLPSDLSFITAFCGCLYAGVIAVPAPVPHRNRPHAALAAIVADSRPAIVLSNAATIAERTGPGAVASDYGMRAGLWLALDDLALEDLALEDLGLDDPDAAPDGPAPVIDPGDIAFLQYTSGSTSLPKGVMVSHANLMHNQAMIRDACHHDGGSAACGWLPMFHDMGLIGNILQPLFMGTSCTLLPPAAVLQKPLRWLQAISRYGATTSGGPNFIYDLCVSRIAPAQMAGLDLSRWRVAFNGAEPVRAETLRRFAEAFGPVGFRASAYQPCYGLAEATLRVLGPASPGTPIVIEVDADALAEDRAEDRAEDGTGARGQSFVGCGPAAPFHGSTLRIVEAATGEALPDRRVGEIWIQGPNVTQGYWRNAAASEACFGARIAGQAGAWLRTGDLGFVAGGELFVTGRLKDMIVLYGRNLYPQDIERVAEASHAAIEPGRGAAFSVVREGTERLVVALEIRPASRRTLQPEAVIGAVRTAVTGHFAVGAWRVVLLGPGAIPRTSSGKVRRSASRDLFDAGLWADPPVNPGGDFRAVPGIDAVSPEPRLVAAIEENAIP